MKMMELSANRQGGEAVQANALFMQPASGSGVKLCYDDFFMVFVLLAGLLNGNPIHSVLTRLRSGD
jgi:hypothetical protein